MLRSFPRQKNKQTEVGEAMRSSSKPNKNMNVECYAVNFIGRGEAGHLKLDFMAKKIIGILLFWFE